MNTTCERSSFEFADLQPTSNGGPIASEIGSMRVDARVHQMRVPGFAGLSAQLDQLTEGVGLKLQSLAQVVTGNLPNRMMTESEVNTIMADTQTISEVRKVISSRQREMQAAYSDMGGGGGGGCCDHGGGGSEASMSDCSSNGEIDLTKLQQLVIASLQKRVKLSLDVKLLAIKYGMLQSL